MDRTFMAHCRHPRFSPAHTKALQFFTEIPGAAKIVLFRKYPGYAIRYPNAAFLVFSARTKTESGAICGHPCFRFDFHMSVDAIDRRTAGHRSLQALLSRFPNNL